MSWVAAFAVAAFLATPSLASEANAPPPPVAGATPHAPMYKGRDPVAGYVLRSVRWAGRIEVYLYRQGSRWIARSAGANPDDQAEVLWASSRTCPALASVVRRMNAVFAARQEPEPSDGDFYEGDMAFLWRAEGYSPARRIERRDTYTDAFPNEAEQLLEPCWTKVEPAGF